MRHLVRIVVIIVALAILVVNPLLETSSAGGTAVLPVGALIDLVAIAAIFASVATWRRRTVA